MSYYANTQGSAEDPNFQTARLAYCPIENPEEKTILDVVVKGIVNSGVIAYVEGIRGFIPASKLSLSYVEDTNPYLNQTIQVQVFDIDKANNRLILSAREILREKAEEERKKKEMQKILTSAARGFSSSIGRELGKSIIRGLFGSRK